MVYVRLCRWNNAEIFKNLWCLAEIATAIQHGYVSVVGVVSTKGCTVGCGQDQKLTCTRLGHCACRYGIDVIMSQAEYARMQHFLMTEGYQAVIASLENVHAEEAKAVRESDDIELSKLIENRPGGFGVLNQDVKLYLEQWFMRQRNHR